MSIDVDALLNRKIEFPKTLDYFLYGGFILGLLTFLYTISKLSNYISLLPFKGIVFFLSTNIFDSFP